MSKEQLIGDHGESFYVEKEIVIDRSSESSGSYLLTASRRESYATDPLVYMKNSSFVERFLMYSGNARNGANKWNTLLNEDNGGMDVYIRKYKTGNSKMLLHLHQTLFLLTASHFA